MLDGPVDPASLEGDDLLRWYRRTPWDIEQQRQAARRQQYIDFFGVDPGGGDNQQGPDQDASGDQSAAQVGQSQPPQQTAFPVPSFGPNGYVPGLLGDVNAPDQPQQQSGAASTSAPQVDNTSKVGVDQAPGAVSASAPPASTVNGGAGLDKGLWSTGADPGLMPISGRSRHWPISPAPAQQAPPTPAPKGPDLTVPLRPSNGFISWLFGGPVPIKDPTGATIGYYDHQAANEGLKITGAYAAVAPLFLPGSWAGDLLVEVAPGAADAIGEGIEEGIANHHPWPKYLGGPDDQALEPLRKSLHNAFHTQLRVTMRKAGFPPMGGADGSTEKWAEVLADPARRQKAVEILRQVTADFDRANGTSIGPHLETVLRQNPSRGLPLQIGVPVPWPQGKSQ